MKLIRFSLSSQGSSATSARPGVLLEAEGVVLDLLAAGVPDPGPGAELAWCDLDHDSHARTRKLVHELESDAAKRDALRERRALIAREDCHLHAPVQRPGKVICIGLNYRDHAAESGLPVPEEPVVFSKFSSCVVGPGEAIEIPPTSTETDYEAELGVVIGRPAKNVPREGALEHVLGYVNLNDVSARDYQFKDGQWQRGKSCDTFCPIGEAIVTTDEIPDPHRLRIQLHLNGETLQDSNTEQLIFGIDEIIAYLSQHVTLEPGDLIATGTPPGVGFARKPPIYLKAGDECVVEIEGLGRLTNPVR